MNDENRFYIRIQTPVHVGCDEVYEPMGFVISEEDAELIAFDPLEFFKTLSLVEKTRFADICRKGSIASLLELHQFMRGKKMVGHHVAASKGFIEQYRSTLAMKATERNVQNELNRFSISRTVFNEHELRPYLPGSAIKGALRTAYLNALAKMDASDRHYDPARNRNAAQQMERDLLKYRELEKDPFRLLKVSDFLPARVTTKILYAVNVKKKLSGSPARGPYQILEVIEPGSLFTGTITVETQYSKQAGIAQPLTWESLSKSSRLFYNTEKKREEEELKGVGLPPCILDSSNGTLPLRIGRHSGSESVTIEGHRYIKIMGARGHSSFSPNGATTFWLASDFSKLGRKDTLRPFGWACLGVLTEEMASTSFEQPRQSTSESGEVSLSDASSLCEKAKESQIPITETWDNAFLSFNAGGGGIVTATAKDGKKAEIRLGSDRSIISEELITRIKKKKGTSAKVTVQRHGNAFTIIKVDYYIGG